MFFGSQEKNCTAKRVNVLFYCKELYLNPTCIVEARTQQGLTRERPSNIQASTETFVAVERGRKVVAEKLKFGPKDRSIRPSKITPARKQSKS